ncbi:ATP-dependent endonuclease [Nakamurella sp. YIM 132084]|uniref:ATP-dependent endonuclease n=1 Tax=Nakamurella leprariae TaxID=2803911 RepID=A0A938YID3_9ACTN|nr:TOPRIM nucleotidyl transferase/hydrolase domain-containing protein [Nakamurella leprariae]MBM9468393.1 ATP-dependent endonuclease [Nakamurella leprariae]
MPAPTERSPSELLPPVRVVVLVEGESDRVAVETLAQRRGRDLTAERVQVLAMGGITQLPKRVAEVTARGVAVVGLYDAAEERWVRRALAVPGHRPGPEPAELAARGFHGCRDDLEDELIRALGVTVCVSLVETAGDLRALRHLAGMPAHRGRPAEAVLHRFLGAGSGRKIRYARLLTAALDLEHVPAPLDAVLAATC